MDYLKNIAIIFTSIFFESFPFLLLGALISSVIETFISNEQMARLIPKNKILGSLAGVFLGFFLPACDCAVIPVAKRLIKKEVPLNVAISFMLASPIINPVVLLSTYNAFYRTNPKIFWLRLIFGIFIALLIGLIIGIIFNKKIVIKNALLEEDDECSCGHSHHDHKHKHSFKENIISIAHHTAIDLFEVVKYLMFGALLASLVQALLPRSILTLFNSNYILSIITLMCFAYLVSLCSTSDSFVGKSLLPVFNEPAIMAYLLLGPMIDIKNTIVLLGNYKQKFVYTLIGLIFLTVFIFSLVIVRLL